MKHSQESLIATHVAPTRECSNGFLRLRVEDPGTRAPSGFQLSAINEVLPQEKRQHCHPSLAWPLSANVTLPLSQKPSKAPQTRPTRLPATGEAPIEVSATNTAQSSSSCSAPATIKLIPCLSHTGRSESLGMRHVTTG